MHSFHNNWLLCTTEPDAVVTVLLLLLGGLELGPGELSLHSLHVWYETMLYVYIETRGCWPQWVMYMFEVYIIHVCCHVYMHYKTSYYCYSGALGWQYHCAEIYPNKYASCQTHEVTVMLQTNWEIAKWATSQAKKRCLLVAWHKNQICCTCARPFLLLGAYTTDNKEGLAC